MSTSTTNGTAGPASAIEKVQPMTTETNAVIAALSPEDATKWYSALIAALEYYYEASKNCAQDDAEGWAFYDYWIEKLEADQQAFEQHHPEVVAAFEREQEPAQQQAAE